MQSVWRTGNNNSEIERLLSSDQLFDIVQSAANGITVQDKNGRLIYANLAAAQAIGFETAADLLRATPKEIFEKFEMFGEDNLPLPVDQLPGRMVLQGHPKAERVVGFMQVGTRNKKWSLVRSHQMHSLDGNDILAVSIFHDITDLKHSETSQRFIAEAGRLFAASLDFETILQSVSDLAARSFSDWCSITLLEDDRLVNVAVSHVDPEKVRLIREMEQLYPPRLDEPTSIVSLVIRSGQAQFIPEISPEMIEDSIRDERYKEAMLNLGIRSVIVLPLIARKRTLGALSLVWADSGHTYTQQDIDLAQELCSRAAIAIDNARLFREVQQVNAHLETRIQQRTNQLQTLITKLRVEISERKKAQDDLLQNETMLAGLFDAAPDATLLVRQDGIVLRANKQVEVIFGYRRDEVVGKPVDNLFPPRYRFMHKNYRHKLLSDPSYRQEGGGVELYALRSDSSEFPVDVVLSPIQTSDGLQTISAIRDVTERKQIEAELAEVQRRLIDSLEAERLILAQEIHDGAIQDLYGVTYAIRGLEGVMEERNILSDGLEFLNTSKESIQQAINTLRSICGELRPPALAPFGLEKAITAHIEQLRDAHPALTIHSELFPDGQTLPEHMRMVLYRIYQHAVSNVLRHASAKNLWVSFSSHSEQITLTVRDDGVGFNLPSRWVELAREGHLGLIGTAERAEALGAQLNISSEPGSGTIIEVVVPLGKPYEPNLQSTRWLLYKK